jgi:hypothetical protein
MRAPEVFGSSAPSRPARHPVQKCPLRIWIELPVRDYLAVVDSPGQLVETHAEAAFERRQIHSPQVGDCLYLNAAQFAFIGAK